MCRRLLVLNRPLRRIVQPRAAPARNLNELSGDSAACGYGPETPSMKPGSGLPPSGAFDTFLDRAVVAAYRAREAGRKLDGALPELLIQGGAVEFRAL